MMFGRSSGRGGGRGGRGRGRRAGGGRASSLAGLFILCLAGVGIWVGAGLVDSSEGGIFPAMEAPMPEDSTRSEARPVPGLDGPRVRVEVLNAGGVSGMASTARTELRDHGFDVVYYGNASSFGDDASAVVGRGERSPESDRLVRAVARSLGIGEVRFEPDSTRVVDVSVFLGADWESADEREPEVLEPESDTDTGSRWNLLRFFGSGDPEPDS